MSPEPGSLNQQESVEYVMSDGKWRTPWELEEEVRHWYGKRSSDSAITARLRNARAKGIEVLSRYRRDAHGVWEYRFPDGTTLHDEVRSASLQDTPDHQDQPGLWTPEEDEGSTSGPASPLDPD